MPAAPQAPGEESSAMPCVCVVWGAEAPRVGRGVGFLGKGRPRRAGWRRSRAADRLSAMPVLLPSPPAGAPEGLEFLSSRPPWACSLCSVGCTSEETLLSHAQGAKHKRRVRAPAGGEGAARAVPRVGAC